MKELPNIIGLLVFPHLRVQNANAISSQMTWGFPPISAFMGFMQALERKMGESDNLQFDAVGVICHSYEVQASGRYRSQFHLTRNPVNKDGKSPSMVEEGRMHFEATVIFGVNGEIFQQRKEARSEIAQNCHTLVSSMRIAGGSVLPSMNISANRRAYFVELEEDRDCRQKQFCKLRYPLLPGFALVARDDLLLQNLKKLVEKTPFATPLDSLLEQSRFNYTSEVNQETKEVTWHSSRQKGSGWVVPIPVGFQGLSELYPPHKVMNARDSKTPFRFVECLYSLGEWVSPHRLQGVGDLLWYKDYDADNRVYRVCNDYYKSKNSERVGA